METGPGIGLAFIMGVFSFLTPCVLPLVPAYLSFISGYSLSEIRKEDKAHRLNLKLLLSALFFILGFSVIFVLLGITAGGLGLALVKIKPILVRLAGALVIFFGLQMMGIFQWLPLIREKRYQGQIPGAGLVKAFLFGLAFAFDWSPCIGPILAFILALAVREETMSQGILLLTFYSLGLAIPFLLSAILVEQFFRFFTRIKAHLRKIEIIAGLILVIAGGLMLIDRFDLLAYYLQRVLPEKFLKLG